MFTIGVPILTCLSKEFSVERDFKKKKQRMAGKKN